MSALLDKLPVYTDFNGLAELRGKAARDPNASLKQVAQQFEAIYLKMMLSSMRDAGFSDGLFDSNQVQFYQGMYDQQLALHLSQSTGIGLADMLVQQLSQQQAVKTPGEQSLLPVQRNPSLVSRTQPEFPLPAYEASVNDDAVPESSPKSSTINQGEQREVTSFDSPGDFIRQVWNLANEAAQELGTDPAVLVAQSALETGWGKSILQDRHGNSSHNLFNIKAGANWSRNRISINTLEYRDGLAYKERSDFRVYNSLRESFNDYVQFIKNSARYQQAVEKAADPDAYISELHKAGYATDPDYPDKVKSIMDRGILKNTLSSIKLSQNETL